MLRSTAGSRQPRKRPTALAVHRPSPTPCAVRAVSSPRCCLQSAGGRLRRCCCSVMLQLSRRHKTLRPEDINNRRTWRRCSHHFNTHSVMSYKHRQLAMKVKAGIASSTATRLPGFCRLQQVHALSPSAAAAAVCCAPPAALTLSAAPAFQRQGTTPGHGRVYNMF
jgi:hypothetical protein